MSPPLLLLDSVQVTSEHGQLCDGYSLRLDGPRALLVGEVEPILGPLFRRARVTAGTFEIHGQPLDQLDPATVGLAPIDPPLPLQRTPLDYVAWSARLAGCDPRAASPLAARLCGEVGLGAWASRPLGQLHAAYRRLTVLAHALVTAPPLLVLEAPLAGLDPQAADYVLRALEQALQGRAALVTAGTPGDIPPRLVELMGPAHITEVPYESSP